MKFLVYKFEDLSKYLTSEQQKALGDIDMTISERRLKEGKSINEYLIINRDEPYAEKVENIMKSYGHWD